MIEDRVKVVSHGDKNGHQEIRTTLLSCIGVEKQQNFNRRVCQSSVERVSQPSESIDTGINHTAIVINVLSRLFDQTLFIYPMKTKGFLLLNLSRTLVQVKDVLLHSTDGSLATGLQIIIQQTAL